MGKLNGIDFSNKLGYKDIVIYMFVKEYELRTAKELSIISSCNYTRLTESLIKLLDEKLIVSTKQHPKRYNINE